MKTKIVKASELGDDWRAEAHIGLPLNAAHRMAQEQCDFMPPEVRSIYAAAPELLAALEKIVWLETSQGVSDDDFDDAMALACAAIAKAKGGAYQPKTGALCGCRPGVQRDNCPNCEGTGYVIDFAAIRASAAKAKGGKP